MDNINLNDFNNICRTCMNYCDIKFFKDHVISKVYYKLTEIHFETNDELPQQICLKCFEKINEIHEFSFQCKRSNSDLLKCLGKLKNPGIIAEQELLEETNEELKTEEITIDEHNLEIFKDEILNSGNEYMIDELKLEKVEKNISEEKIISETKDQLVNCSGKNTVNLQILDCPYKCEQCLKSFKKSNHLKRHMVTHRRKRTRKCTVCSRVFHRTKDLKYHMRMHTGERPYECELCSKSYMRSSHLKLHIMRTHTSERPYKCEQCLKTFAKMSTLTAHMRTHAERERRFKCEQCPKLFIQLQHLERHKRVHH